MLNRSPVYCSDALGDGFLVDVESDVVNTFHGSLLVGLTRGDLFDPAAHYELSDTWRLPLLATYAFKHNTYSNVEVPPINESVLLGEVQSGPDIILLSPCDKLS
jgi:hypothetical protein